MARSLSAAQIALLANSQYIVEDLIEVYASDGTVYYWTTGQFTVSVDTSTTATAQTFTPSNNVSFVADIIESYELNNGNISIQLTILDNSSPSIAGSPGVISKLATNFLKTRIVVNKMFRDSTTFVADSTNLIQVYDGTVTEFNIETDESVQTVTLQCQSVFNSFEKIRSRMNTDLQPQYGGTIYWGSINVS